MVVSGHQYTQVQQVHMFPKSSTAPQMQFMGIHPKNNRGQTKFTAVFVYIPLFLFTSGGTEVQNFLSTLHAL